MRLDSTLGVSSTSVSDGKSMADVGGLSENRKDIIRKNYQYELYLS